MVRELVFYDVNIGGLRVLKSNFACGAPIWSCLVVIGIVLYIVSLSCVSGASCWSSGSRMICGRGVGAGGISGDCRSGMT